MPFSNEPLPVESDTLAGTSTDHCDPLNSSINGGKSHVGPAFYDTGVEMRAEVPTAAAISGELLQQLPADGRAELDANRLPAGDPSDGGVRTPAAAVEAVESPNWLPEGWVMETRVRTSGLKAGAKDRFYYDPTSKHRFRSKREVFRFLETGKRKTKSESNAAVMPPLGPNPPKKEDSALKPPDRFDSIIQQLEVRTYLNGYAERSTPCFEHKELPRSSNQDQEPLPVASTSFMNSLNIGAAGVGKRNMWSNSLHTTDNPSRPTKIRKEPLRGWHEHLEILGRELCRSVLYVDSKLKMS